MRFRYIYDILSCYFFRRKPYFNKYHPFLKKKKKKSLNKRTTEIVRGLLENFLRRTGRAARFKPREITFRTYTYSIAYLYFNVEKRFACA